MKEKKAKKESETANRADKVSFLSSLRFKILFLTILAVVVVMAVLVSSTQKLLKSQAKSYLLDVTTSNATMLETLRKSIRLNEPEEKLLTWYRICLLLRNRMRQAARRHRLLWLRSAILWQIFPIMQHV